LIDDNGHVIIKINNPAMKTIIFEALNKLEYKYVLQNNYITINIYANTLHMNRNLPDWVWELSSNQCQTLIHAMCMSDGIVYDQTVIYYTYSSHVADDFMRLCLHAGWSSSKEKDLLCSDLWKLPVFKGQQNFKYVNDVHHTTKEEIYGYLGSVYCLEVPSEIFYVRRNGKSCWTGNSRASSGPIVMLTHQPSDGRARDGGLRMGEMEVECCWAHGGLQFLKERMMECSDNYRVHVCKNCGLMAIVNPEKKIFMCKSCKNNTNFGEIRIPYACKLLFHEVQTMGIAARFITK
jgi:ribosomal protein L37AE/L43A